MARLPLKMNGESPGGRLCQSLTNDDRALRIAAQVVKCVHLGDTLLSDQLRALLPAGADLLPVLKNEIHVPVQQLPCQLHGKTAQSRAVPIMSARMAPAVAGGGVGYARRLPDRKRVKIRAKGDGIFCLVLLRRMAHSVKPRPAVLRLKICVCSNEVHQMLLRPVLMQRQLRMMMKLMPQLRNSHLGNFIHKSFLLPRDAVPTSTVHIIHASYIFHIHKPRYKCYLVY